MYGTSYKTVSVLHHTTPVAAPVPCFAVAACPYVVKRVLNARNVKGSPRRAHTFEVLASPFLQCSTVFELFQCVFPVSQRMVYSDYVKQRILVYYHFKKNCSQIVRCLAEEGHTVCKASVLKFLRRYRETGTIARAPGTGQASKLTDQLREIIEDQMKKNNETTGLELQKLLNKYFELKNSWGAGAPLNSNYLLLLLYCSHPYYMNP